MARRLSNAPLWLRLLVRRLRSPEGKLAPLAVISIAVSVTLATGLEMASRSAQSQLEATAEAITGSAEIEITAGGVGLPEAILDQVRDVPGVLAASPFVSVRLRIVGQNYSLNVIGVDLVAEEQVRNTAIERSGLRIRDPLRLLASPNSVVVTLALLDRLGLPERFGEGKPAELTVRANGIDTSLVVQGVLQPTGLAAAFSGQVALMDVYAAQMLGGRVGLFDRIDVVPERGHDLDGLIAALSSKLDGVATVQHSSGRSQIAEDLLQIVRKAALMIAGAAAVVASLLTYATTAQWVERQRRQLATLRAVGMEAHRVRRMIFVEVTAMALLGTALGIAGGVAISPPLLAALSAFLKVVAIEQITDVSLQLSTLGVAVAVGFVASVAGSALPAIRAGRRFTLDSLDLETGPRSVLAIRPWIGAIALAALACLATIGRGRIYGSAMIHVGLLLSFGVLAILLLAPTVLRAVRIALGLIENTWPSVGHLATRFFRLRPWTFAVALAAISTLVGALVTVFLLIATIRSGFERWAEARYPDGAILVSPRSFADPFINELLSAQTMNLIRTTPGVAAVDEQYKGYPSVVFRGETVPLAAQSMAIVGSRGHITSVDRPSAELARLLQADAVAVSTGFAKRFGLGTGDTIDLDTRDGAKRFSIAGTYEDFGETTGSILLDLGTFDAHWERTGASAAVVWLDGSTETILSEIRRRVGPREDLFFADVTQVVEANRKLTEVFSSTLHVLGGFISSLGGIGVMILLVGIIAERRRDLAVLRAAGAEPRQLVIVVLSDAFALGVLGAGCGLALGFTCASPAADVLRESLGWILEQRWTAPELPAVILGAIAAALLGALLPARMAYRATPDDVFGPE